MLLNPCCWLLWRASLTCCPTVQVGVVGRTGSGKSTLLLALYRMFNLESGSIRLDGIDISTLGLNQLRRGLSIIPQVGPAS